MTYMYDVFVGSLMKFVPCLYADHSTALRGCWNVVMWSKVVAVPAYVEDSVAMKVVKLIQSYTRIVNKIVWRK